MSAIAARFIIVAAVVAAAVPAAASAHSTAIGFSFVPNHVVQGDSARVSINVRPGSARCTLSVRYHGGTLQPALPSVLASHGHATWTWQVPKNVQAGAATATARCARAGAASRQLVIVGRLIAPSLTVTKSGFSTRPNPSRGTRLSYGLIIHNDSATKDVLNVTVQVNFVLADNTLLGTDAQRVTAIPAGADFALGHQISFPGDAPIVRLEVVIQGGTTADKSVVNPSLANIHLVPQIADPRWVGTVEGELQNVDPVNSLRSANLSAVVFDSAGNIIGGGTGVAFQLLPPGTREFIQLGSGFDVIPWDRAASTMVSMTSTWQQPGA